MLSSLARGAPIDFTCFSVPPTTLLQHQSACNGRSNPARWGLGAIKSGVDSVESRRNHRLRCESALEHRDVLQYY